MDPLDPRLYVELAGRAKIQLRQRMRALRSAHPAAALAERSARIVERLSELPALRTSRGVALFFPMLERREVDLRELDARLRGLEKDVYYPGVAPSAGGGTRSEIRRTQSLAELEPRGSQFAEPPPEAPVAERGTLDLVVVPALAVSPGGHRLGYGSGFYDATLPDFCPPAVAVVVAYDFQLLAELPVLPHDVACDVVITETRTIVVPSR